MDVARANRWCRALQATRSTVGAARALSHGTAAARGRRQRAVAASRFRLVAAAPALRRIAGVFCAGLLVFAPLPAAAQPVAGAAGAARGSPAASAARAGPSAAAPSALPPATAAALARIGRVATPAELRAWDIDVRADFAGLPPGAGSVAAGERTLEAKCASCHGVFGESNEVFTPLVGGTTKRDIETGRVQALATGGHPHRTTLMRASRLSTLWDYVHRAMPWNAPKSLTPDEVYGVLAYMLNLGEIVPSDFTLSDRNIAETERRLPNRHGKVFFRDLWEVQGQGDVANPACMRDCPVEGKLAAAMPDAVRNANGNIAEQVRPFGPARGTDTSLPPRREPVGRRRSPPAVVVTSASATSTMPAASPADLLKANACTACHATSSRLIGPAFQDVAARYAGRADAVDYLAGRIRSGGQGVWGSIPMPGQAQLPDADARAIAAWLVGGAK
jgi:cytochrome c